MQLSLWGAANCAGGYTGVRKQQHLHNPDVQMIRHLQRASPPAPFIGPVLPCQPCDEIPAQAALNPARALGPAAVFSCYGGEHAATLGASDNSL